MGRRIAAVVAAAVGLGLVLTGVALASGRGTITTTQHQRDVHFFTQNVVNPCNGEAGKLKAVAATEVFHITQFTNGDEFWVTGTAQGTATFTPADPSGTALSGHFAAWFGESSNEKNDVQHDTNTFQLWGTDGSHVVVHASDHLSTNAQGQVTVNFSKFTFNCG